jgi:hypothetical protein
VINPLVKAGFILEQILVPLPTEEFSLLKTLWSLLGKEIMQIELRIYMIASPHFARGWRAKGASQ